MQEPAQKKMKAMKASECPLSHASFQKRHCLADVPAVRGHWALFLQCCEDPSIITACPVCCELLKEVRPAASETGSQLVLDPDAGGAGEGDAAQDGQGEGSTSDEAGRGEQDGLARAKLPPGASLLG